MSRNKVLFFLAATLLSAQITVAQNNTNSPYTRFGYGDLSDVNSGEQKAMGGVAIGARSSRSINASNPASYSSVDSMTFMFDIGATGLMSRFSSTSGNTNKFTANLNYITMQFPLGRNIGFSAGLLPYSSVGYNYYKTDIHLTGIQDENFDSIPNRTSYSGLGGLSQVYGGLSAKLLNHISVGANAYYLFGNIYNQRSSRILSFSDSLLEVNYTSANSLRFRYGVQFFNTFAKKHDITLGFIFEPKTKLNGTFSQTVYGTTNDITPANANDSVFELPQMYGVGLYYTYNNRLSLGLDYTLQQWSNAKYRGAYNLTDRSKLSTGFEYTPNPRGRKFGQRLSYRGGFSLSSPYYKINNTTPPKNYTISGGIGLPIYNNNYKTTNMLNVALEYGKIGSSDVLRENYLKLTVNLAFDEHWFFKRKL